MQYGLLLAACVCTSQSALLRADSSYSTVESTVMPQRQARLRRGPHKARGDQQPGDNEEETEPLHARAHSCIVWCMHCIAWRLHRMCSKGTTRKRSTRSKRARHMRGKRVLMLARGAACSRSLSLIVAHCHSSSIKAEPLHPIRRMHDIDA